MKVLMLSTDASILEEGTEANARMREYAGLFEQLFIIVASQRKANVRLPRQEARNDKSLGNLFIYATNSRNKLSALWEAYRIGRRILDNKVLDPSFRWDDSINGSWVITAQDPFELGLVGYFLKRKLGAALQLQVHTDFLSSYFWHESLKNKIRVLIAKWLLPKADRVRVVSERIKRSLITNYQLPITKIEVLPIFVDTEKIKNASVKMDLRKKYPQFDFIILMASRLSREKNIGMAIGVMAEIVKRYPKAGLVIVGEGPEAENQRLNIKNQKLEESIKMEPWTDDLASYYKTADLFLLTSLYEGYGRTIVEAMAVGLPIVMTDVGLAGDLVKDGENGYVIDVGDQRGLAERVVKLIENPELRKEFSARNSEAAESLLSREIYLQKYKAALEEIHA